MLHICPTCGTELLFEATALDPVCKLMESRINHLEACGLSYSHIRKQRSFLRHHIGPYWGDRGVKAISSMDVHDFHTTLLRKGLASKTIKHIMDALKGLFNQLYNPGNGMERREVGRWMSEGHNEGTTGDSDRNV
ncbi:MAG: hypothetical protein HQK95_09745 [Nitrospirae bacterium]|nr:hypothetical protein [Nitrospirota bacterium]